jgi:hypothetical protein
MSALLVRSHLAVQRAGTGLLSERAFETGGRDQGVTGWWAGKLRSCCQSLVLNRVRKGFKSMFTIIMIISRVHNISGERRIFREGAEYLHF